jgi:thiamine pyrophosphokinase
LLIKIIGKPGKNLIVRTTYFFIILWKKLVIEENDMRKVRFDGEYDALLCLNANMPGKKFFKKFRDIPIIAADGAANQLIDKKVVPDFIIGDLDSIDDEVKTQVGNVSEIIHEPSQEKNDFQKILEFSLQKGWNNLLICGFHGGQLEHTFNNWSVFMRFSRELNLCIYDVKRYGIAVFDEINLSTYENEIISLIPQGKCRLSTKNLKWELINDILELGIREGARNRAIGDEIELDIHEGSLIVFFDAKVPLAPNVK